MAKWTTVEMNEMDTVEFAIAVLEDCRNTSTNEGWQLNQKILHTQKDLRLMKKDLGALPGTNTPPGKGLITYERLKEMLCNAISDAKGAREGGYEAVLSATGITKEELKELGFDDIADVTIASV